MELSDVVLRDVVLRAESLRRSYGDRTVVDIGELDVRRGEVLAILGPNGAGKSTLFRMLLLLEPPDAGRILFNGTIAGAGDTASMRRMAAVFQRPYLFDGTVAENVAYGLRARGADVRQMQARTDAALELLQLSALRDADVRTLSGGEAQRVGLARALVLDPEVLALDEPTLQLDVTVRRRFREDLERVARSRSRATILITHDPADAFALADRIAVMEAGRIVQTATPSELLMSPRTAFIAEFTGAELLLHGTVVERDGELALVDLGAPRARAWTLAPMDATVGASVHVAYRPEDVTLADAHATAETSAVNRFALTVDAVVPGGALVRVRLRGDVPLSALITQRSMAALGVAPGRTLVAQIKATALRAYVTG